MAEVVPSGFGVALSPVPILAMILLLGRPHAPGRAVAFALGWVAGLAVAITVLIGPGDAGGAGSLGPGPEVAVGALLVGLAVWQWRRRPRDGEPSLLARAMLAVDRLGTGRCAVLGAASCCVNPKNLALTATAGTSIGDGGRGGVGTVALAGVFVVLGSVTVAGPALWCALAPGRAARPLGAARDLLVRHGAAIAVTVSAVVGVVLLGDGIGGL